MLQVLVHRARAAAEDVADVLAGFALHDPVEDFGLALGEAEGGDEGFDGGGIVFLAQHDQPFVVAGLVVEGGEQAAGAVGDEQGLRFAAVVAGGVGGGDPGDQFFRGDVFRVGEVVVHQPAGEGRLPHQLAVGGAHGHGGLAEGVEGAAGLAHLAGVLHVGGDAGEHFRRADRLGDVVGAAGGKGGHHVLGFGQPGHEDDGDVLGRKVGLEPAGHLEAVHAGHQRVEQDDVGQALAGPLQRRFAVGGHQHGVAGFIKGVVEQREVFRDVVDDQDDVRNQAFI